VILPQIDFSQRPPLDHRTLADRIAADVITSFRDTRRVIGATLRACGNLGAWSIHTGEPFDAPLCAVLTPASLASVEALRDALLLSAPCEGCGRRTGRGEMHHVLCDTSVEPTPRLRDGGVMG